MTRLQRTMKVKRGKRGITWAKEMFDYMNTTHGKPAIHLLDRVSVTFRLSFGRSTSRILKPF